MGLVPPRLIRPFAEIRLTREEEIALVEAEVERMYAAGIPPHLMYENVEMPVQSDDMLVSYEECDK